MVWGLLRPDPVMFRARRLQPTQVTVCFWDQTRVGHIQAWAWEVGEDTNLVSLSILAPSPRKIPWRSNQ